MTSATDHPNSDVPGTPPEDIPSTLDGSADRTLPVEPGDESTDPSSRVEQIRAHASSSDRYKLRGRVGRGGQGAVYEVWDEDLHRRLAMKVVLGKDDERSEPSPADTPPADPESLSRFLEEAQITGQLDHPGVVPIHELGLDPFGHVFFTMRLVRGDDLHTIIRRVHSDQKEDADWSQVRVLGAVLKACEALAYAHAKKVIHRDLKPSNLMIGKYGEVYVMDWGLARILGQKDHHDLRIREAGPRTSSLKTDRKKSRGERIDSPLETMDGRVLGTPSYMPPEQAEGRIEEMGPASDVYSMGAVLYQLMTGRIPYVPESGNISAHTVLARVLDGPPKPVAELAPDAPAELVAICEKAMARTMTDRYSDMESLALDLRAFLEGRVVGAYESGAWAELRKWVRRNRGWAATGAVAMLLLVGVLGWALVERKRADDEATRANHAASAEKAAKEEAIEARSLAERREKEAEAEKARVLRLSDVKLVEDYAAEAGALWPAEPHRIADMKAWLGQADELYGRLPGHEESLALIRNRAIPRSPEQIEAERTRHPKYPDLLREQGRLDWLRSLTTVATGGPPPELPLLEVEDLPTEPDALNQLARQAVDPDRSTFGEELRAAAVAERMAALDPPSVGPWETIAWARFASGRFDAAMTAIDTAIERAKSDEIAALEETKTRLTASMVHFRGEGAAARFARRVEEVEDSIEELTTAVNERQQWDFPPGETDLAWQHQVLEELVTGLRAFGEEGGALADVAERLAWAEGVTELTITDGEASSAWARAIASIADRTECPLYDGFELKPQLGLIPLDRNPRTRLWEFWHPQTGTRPDPNLEWDPRTPGKCNRWIITEETGLVFVLIPGGTFRMGAERPPIGAVTDETGNGLRVTSVAERSLAGRGGVEVGDILRSLNGVEISTRVDLTACLPTLRTGEEARFVVQRGETERTLSAIVEDGVGSPNIDPWAEHDESPVNDVTLRPYFLSKYEMTQGEWSRSPSEESDPSFYKAGSAPGGQTVTGHDPVEQVSWMMCRENLHNLGLALPTEAQWEAGCRAGTGSVFWSGNQFEDLQDVANIADAFAKRIVPSWNCTMEIDNGYVIHAPVGSLLPNAYGLHDIHGGVWEWCLDSRASYGTDVQGPDGLRSDDPASTNRMYRGGCFSGPAAIARSSCRISSGPEGRHDFLGVRPARAISD